MKKLIIPILLVLLSTVMVYADAFSVNLVSPTQSYLAASTNYTFQINVTNPDTSSNVSFVRFYPPGSFLDMICLPISGYSLTTGSNYCYYNGTLQNGTSQVFNISAVTPSAPPLATHFWIVQANGSILTTESLGTQVDAGSPSFDTSTLRASSLTSATLDGTQYLSTGTINITINVTENVDLQNVTLIWNKNGAPNTTKLMTNSTSGTTRVYSATLNSSEIANNDTAQFKFIAYDTAGNNAELNNSNNYYKFVSDGSGPQATIVSPSNNSVTYNLKPTIQVMWDESLSGMNLTSITFTLDGLPVSLQVNNLTTSAYTPTTSLAEGTHYITITAKDNVGNTNSVSWQFTIQAPLLTSAIINYPYSGAYVSGTTPISVLVDGSDYINITRVDFYVNGSYVGNDTSNPYWLNWNTASFPDGSTTEIYVIAYATSDSLTSSKINVTINQSKIYYTQSEVNNTIKIVLQDYYNQTEINNILSNYYNITQSENLFLNQSEVNSTIEQYLFNYYIKSQIYNITQTNQTIERYLLNFYNQTTVDNILINYYNQTQTNQTIQQYLNDYYNISMTNSTIELYLLNFYNKTTVDNILYNFYNSTQTNLTIEEYLSHFMDLSQLNATFYNRSEIDYLFTFFNATDLTGYYNKTETNETILSFLQNYYNTTDTEQLILLHLASYYNITDIDSILANHYNTSLVYNKTEVDNIISGLSNTYYNMTQIDNIFYNKTQIDYLIAGISLSNPKIMVIDPYGTVTNPTPSLKVITDVNSTCRIGQQLRDYQNMEWDMIGNDTTHIYALTSGTNNLIEGYNIYYVDCVADNNKTLTSPGIVAFNLDTTNSYDFWDKLFNGWNVKFYLSFIFDKIANLNGNTSIASVFSSITGKYDVIYQKAADGSWKSYDPAVPSSQNDLNTLNNDISPLYIHMTSTSNIAITKDTNAPPAITNLTASLITNTSILWNWNNPSVSDFKYAMLLFNDTISINTINNFYLTDNSLNGTNYTIAIRTIDLSGNINDTWVNLTASTS